jgi:hypothetical protein
MKNFTKPIRLAKKVGSKLKKSLENLFKDFFNSIYHRNIAIYKL